MKKIVLLLLFLLIEQVLFPKNLVLIQGKKRSRIQSNGTSQKSSFKADQIDSTNLKTYVKSKASLSTKESSEITANDFHLPKVRGQRSSNTEIWLNESLIYDPWLSLPISYSFNSKQFSRVNLFEGLPPYNLASSTPFGLLQYQKTHFKDEVRVGSRFGHPFGKSFFGNIERKKFLADSLHFSFFFSVHNTKGSYSYWNPNGTPFNPKNGEISHLKHNKQDSFFLAPSLGFKYKEILLRFYSFIFKQCRELPLLRKTAPLTSSEDSSFLNQIELKWTPQRNKTDFLKLKKLIFSLNHQIGNKKFKTPFHESENKSNHLRFSLIPSLEIPYAKIYSSFSYSFSKVSYFLKQKSHEVKRDAFDLYTAYQTKFSSPFNLENKYHLRFSRDSKKSSISALNFSYAFSLFYKKGRTNSYFQFSQSKRLPNLLEELGDYHFISSSEGLKAERTTHFELGGMLRGKNSFFGNIFFDFSSDKIKFMPSSFQKVKALNLSHTRTLGFELSHSLETQYFDMFSGFSYLQNLDISNPQKNYTVPLSSFYVLTNHMEVKVKRLFFHLSQRLNGPYYYDSANTMLVDLHLLSDLSLGYSHKVKKTLFSLKFSLNNLLDVTSLKLETTGKTKRVGKIPRSEFYGVPLGGRSWTIDLEAKF